MPIGAIVPAANGRQKEKTEQVLSDRSCQTKDDLDPKALLQPALGAKGVRGGLQLTAAAGWKEPTAW
jgi:hypothetical protein